MLIFKRFLMKMIEYYPNFFILIGFFLKCRLTCTSTLLNIFVIVTCKHVYIGLYNILHYTHDKILPQCNADFAKKIDFICISICINIISRLLRQHLHLYLIIQLIHLINMNDIEKWKWNILSVFPCRWARSNSSSNIFLSL